jgi:nitroimidazol reductase NimA-like FMN-containing flavoprotein (pyridoxamine 5'-phosphate oxidase superfamily)
MTENIRTIPEQQCRELLTTTTVGRVAFVDDDGQQLIPLNFAVIDDEIYFRTAPESLLDGLAGGHRDVAFGVDYHSGSSRDAWNVTVRGSTSRVSDPDVYQQVMSWPRLRPWAGGERGVVIHLKVRSIAGRRVHADRP